MEFAALITIEADYIHSVDCLYVVVMVAPGVLLQSGTHTTTKLKMSLFHGGGVPLPSATIICKSTDSLERLAPACSTFAAGDCGTYLLLLQ